MTAHVILHYLFTEQANRLNLQHYNWKQSLGYLINPRAVPKIDNPKIADLGTGTGIWLLDLSESLSPSAKLHGFDIDLSQAPPTEWLPSNVLMRKLDVFEQLPDDLVGEYGKMGQGLVDEKYQQ